MRLFMGGGLILGILLGLNYYVKQSQFHVFGITTIIIALITYCIAPIVDTQPSWFYVMVIVTVLLLTELKHTFTEFAQRMKNDRDDHSCQVFGYQWNHFADVARQEHHSGYQSDSLFHMVGYGGGFRYLVSVLSIKALCVP